MQYNFGLWSCFYNNVEDVILTIGFGIMVQFFCTYVTLPLYALITQVEIVTHRLLTTSFPAWLLVHWLRLFWSDVFFDERDNFHRPHH